MSIPNPPHAKRLHERRTMDNLATAADFLNHYHQAHTDDIVTILHGGDTDIYLVSDPEWRRKFTEFVKPIMRPKQ